MASLFDSIVAGGYFVGFGGLSESQEHCKRFTNENLAALLHIRQREKFVKEVRVCCCGYGPADEDEPLEDSNFSQFQFYLPYTNDLIFFHDKFDFLIKCVANGVCKIETGFEERYMEALLNAMTFRDTTVPQAPEYVLDLRTLQTPRTVGEIPRTYEENQVLIDSYVHKRNGYVDKLRSELQQLEDEQFRDEKMRGEHASLMGWSNPNTPTRDAVPPRPQEHERRSPHQDAVDASVTRIRSAIELARAETEDDALIQQYMNNGGSVDPPPIPSNIPLINMMLHVQQEEIRQQQLAKERELLDQLAAQEEAHHTESSMTG